MANPCSTCPTECGVYFPTEIDTDSCGSCETAMEVRSAFICPISHEIMIDPVMDPEGNTYERQKIEEWLGRQERSPLTNTTLSSSQLIPNRALKEAIQLFLDENPHASEMSRERMPAGMVAKPAGMVTKPTSIGSFACCSSASPPWMQFDVRGDHGTPVQDYAQLDAGTLVSFDCVYPVGGQLAEAKYRHHGVYIGTLTADLWRQVKDCDPALLNKRCVVHLQRDERRQNFGVVEIQTVSDFSGGRTVFAHKGSGTADPRAIVQRAIREVDKEVPYNHKKYNCEHFATWVSEGVGNSEQAENAEELETATWTALAVGAAGVLAAGAMMFLSGSSSASERERRRR